jgi:hypothetical protein
VHEIEQELWRHKQLHDGSKLKPDQVDLSNFRVRALNIEVHKHNAAQRVRTRVDNEGHDT